MGSTTPLTTKYFPPSVPASGAFHVSARAVDVNVCTLASVGASGAVTSSPDADSYTQKSSKYISPPATIRLQYRPAATVDTAVEAVVVVGK